MVKKVSKEDVMNMVLNSCIFGHFYTNSLLIDYFQLFFSEPFVLGGQPDDDRIFVSSRTERAPDYTEGEQE